MSASLLFGTRTPTKMHVSLVKPPVSAMARAKREEELRLSLEAKRQAKWRAEFDAHHTFKDALTKAGEESLLKRKMKLEGAAYTWTARKTRDSAWKLRAESHRSSCSW